MPNYIVTMETVGQRKIIVKADNAADARREAWQIEYDDRNDLRSTEITDVEEIEENQAPST
jgi:hypothetical protein